MATTPARATAFPSLINGTQSRLARAAFVAAVRDGIGEDGRRLATELAGSVAAELERRNIDMIAFDGEGEDFVAALQRHRVNIDPDASFRIGLADAANPSLFDPPEKANLAAREITFAASACGRGVTRRCLLDRLGANYPSR